MKALDHSSTGTRVQEIPAIHLIIPFRNESRTLPALLERLTEFQDEQGLTLYPLFVDDHSEDSSVDIIKKSILRGLKAELLTSNATGKKAALLTGRQYLKAGFHVTMDADVVPHPQWKNKLSAALSTSADMVILPVLPNQPGNWLSAVSALETISLLGVTMATASIGHPTMANGANLLLRNQMGLDDRPDISSGDDVFVLHDLKRKGGSISAIPRLELAVYTDTPGRWYDWFEQRKRWASKSSNYRDKDTLFLGWSMLFVNGSLLLLLMSLFFTSTGLWMFITLFLTKLALDFLFLHSVCKYYRMTSLLYSYPLAAALNPFQYLVVFLGSRFGGYTWKGRSHSE